jgi:protein FrlC
MGMKISTATSALVNYPLDAALAIVSETGFDGVDVWCGRPHLYRQDHSPEELRRLKQQLQDSGLTAVTAMPAFFRYPYSLSSPNAVIRSDSMQYVVDCMENALAIGCTQVLIVPSRSLVGQALEDASTRFTDSLSQLSKKAEHLGVRLGVETLNPQLSDYAKQSAQVMAFIDAIGSDSLGVVLDTGHLCLSGEDFTSAVKNVGSRLMEVHFNDNDVRSSKMLYLGRA